jgi:hypothetical protein
MNLMDGRLIYLLTSWSSSTTLCKTLKEYSFCDDPFTVEILCKIHTTFEYLSGYYPRVICLHAFHVPHRNGVALLKCNYGNPVFFYSAVGYRLLLIFGIFSPKSFDEDFSLELLFSPN